MPRKDKKDNALGKGLDALISQKYIKDDPDNDNEVLKQGIKVEKAPDLNQEIVESIIDEINKNPRISLWSAKAAAVLRYLRKTEPEFSISNEASILIEDAVKEKYPEIWEMFEEHFNKSL